MTEEQHNPETPGTEAQNAQTAADALAANDALLDEKLAQPILRGDKGLDAAQVWAGAFLVVVAGLIAYSNAFRLPFHAEDQRLITENAALQTMTTLPEGLAAEPSAPFAMLTFAVNWWITPGNPVAFHAVNVLLHLAGSLVLFLLLRTLLTVPVPVSMALAMLYTLYPVHTAYVDCVAGRVQLLGLFFTWSALLAYVKARGEDGVRPAAMGMTLLCGVMAHYSGLSMLGVLIFMVALDLLQGGLAVIKRNLSAHALAWSVFAAVVLAGVCANMASARDALDAPTLGEMVRRTALPDVLGALAFHKIVSIPMAAVTGAVVVFAAVLYRVPSEKLKSPELRVAWGLALVAVLLTCGISTYRRNMVWASEGALWADAISRLPNKAEPLRQLGRLLLAIPVPEHDNAAATQNAQEAEQNLRAALDIEPGSAAALTSLGNALARQGKEDEAREAFLSALRNDLTSKDAVISLALLFDERAAKGGKKGDIAQAAEYYKRADALGALPWELKTRYGMALASLGRFEEAQDVLSKIPVPAENATSPIPATLQRIQETLKRGQELEQQALLLQQQAPTDPGVPKMLAQSLLMRGRDLQAYYILQRAIQSPVADFGTWILTGLACARLEMGAQFAVDHATPPLKPAEVASAWADLARTCASDGLWPEAEAYLASAAATTEIGAPIPMTMAGIAQQLKRSDRAEEYFRKAAEALPQSPEPWLRLCDLALEAKSSEEAKRCLSEAQSRGAGADDVASRQQKLDAAPVAPAVTQ